MNKIVSNFYLIRLDGEPVYVGYTNRPIKQRFSEHKKDKDFGDIEPTVESLGKLEYDFTWDMELINSYAKQVSDRETELIEKYGTQDSVWQKGTSGNLGGQTWADVKGFVRKNRDNPLFRELDEEVILVYLETSDRVSAYMNHFVNHMDDSVVIYINSFLYHMDDPISVYMGNFVVNMNDPVDIYMKSFVSTMNDSVSAYMKHFVHHMDNPVSVYMVNFVHHMDNPVSYYMKSFVSTMNDPVIIYMNNFVSTMNDPVIIYMNNFVGNMKKSIDN